MAIRRYAKIYYLFCKYAAIKMMAYRASFFIELLVEFGYSFSRMFFIAVVYINVDEVAGWTYYEVLFFMGLNIVSSELILGAFSIWNLREIPERIKTGEIDMVLLKPINVLFSLTLQYPYFSGFISANFGFFIMLYAYFHLGYSLTVQGILSGVFIFFTGHVIAYSILVLFTSLTFRFVNADTLVRIGEMLLLSFKINPHQVYYGGMKILFYFILPVAFIASIPAEMMLKGANLEYIVISGLLAIIFFTLTVKVWNFMIRQYTSAGG